LCFEIFLALVGKPTATTRRSLTNTQQNYSILSAGPRRVLRASGKGLRLVPIPQRGGGRDYPMTTSETCGDREKKLLQKTRQASPVAIVGPTSRELVNEAESDRKPLQHPTTAPHSPQHGAMFYPLRSAEAKWQTSIPSGLGRAGDFWGGWGGTASDDHWLP